MQTDPDLEDAYREAQEFAAIGEDISHWEYLLVTTSSTAHWTFTFVLVAKEWLA